MEGATPTLDKIIAGLLIGTALVYWIKAFKTESAIVVATAVLATIPAARACRAVGQRPA